jgi:FixJ family two-component response regulator
MARAAPSVAIVDDDESVCRALRRLLVASGLKARTFPSGEAFLQSLVSERPDCVVLDLQMPGLSGMDVLKELARTGADLPVIVITGYDEPRMRLRCLKAGALAYLPKPLDDVALLQAISNSIHRSVN